MELEKLKEIFYNDFKILDFEEALSKYHNIEKREQLIQELAENQEQAYNINKNYGKILNEISKIFIYNYRQEQELKKEIEKLQELDKKQNEKIKKLHDKISEEENKREKIKSKYKIGAILAMFAGGKLANKTCKKYKW